MSAEVEPIGSSVSQTVSIREAAAILGIGESTLQERSRTLGYVVPGLPILKIGANRRIPRAKLEAYAAGNWTPEVDG